MQKLQLLFSLMLAMAFNCSLTAQVTNPLITTWKLNTTNHMVNGILTDVQDVHYDNNYVYVHTSGVPSYYTFNNGNVNDAADKNHTWRFPIAAQQHTGTATSSLGGGQMGVFTDGDEIFNAEDANSYQNANVWHQLAYYFEHDFDFSWGHSTPFNEYHHHVVNIALIDTAEHHVHSPIIGWMFDGYPIYGPYGYSNSADTNSAIQLMTSSYAFRNITQRTTLPNGTSLQPNQYGPAVSNQYPVGCYREDYIYTQGSGTMDEHNGRFCKTPEFPNGTYAYFCTLDSNNVPRYPYTIGQSFYGVVLAGNQGPNGGSATVPAGATLYQPATTGISGQQAMDVSIFPNPAQDVLFIKLPANSYYSIQLTDMHGRTVLSENTSAAIARLDLSQLSHGAYVVTINNNYTGEKAVSKCLK